MSDGSRGGVGVLFIGSEFHVYNVVVVNLRGHESYRQNVENYRGNGVDRFAPFPLAEVHGIENAQKSQCGYCRRQRQHEKLPSGAL